MACPFFEPTAPLDGSEPARAPLGGVFTGYCHAEGDSSAAPPHAGSLREICNFGYGRGRCPRFPAGAAFDAVRFSSDGQRVLCILERDHIPVEFSPAGLCSDPVLSAQFRAFERRLAMKAPG